MCIHTCMYIYMYIYVYIHTHAHTCIYVHIRKYIHMYKSDEGWKHGRVNGLVGLVPTTHLAPAHTQHISIVGQGFGRFSSDEEGGVQGGSGGEEEGGEKDEGEIKTDECGVKFGLLGVFVCLFTCMLHHRANYVTSLHHCIWHRITSCVSVYVYVTSSYKLCHIIVQTMSHHRAEYVTSLYRCIIASSHDIMCVCFHVRVCHIIMQTMSHHRANYVTSSHHHIITSHHVCLFPCTCTSAQRVYMVLVTNGICP